LILILNFQIRFTSILFGMSSCAISLAFILRFATTLGDGGSFTVTDSFTSTAMYMSFVTRNLSQVYSFDDLADDKKAITIFVAVIQFYTAIVDYGCIIIFILCSLAAFEISSKFCRMCYYPMSPNKPSLHLLTLLKYYEELCGHFERLNELSSGILVVLFLDVMTWLSTKALAFVDTTNWYNRFMNFLNWALYAVGFMLAARANKKVWKTEMICKIHKQSQLTMSELN